MIVVINTVKSLVVIFFAPRICFLRYRFNIVITSARADSGGGGKGRPDCAHYYTHRVVVIEMEYSLIGTQIGTLGRFDQEGACLINRRFFDHVGTRRIDDPKIRESSGKCVRVESARRNSRNLTSSKLLDESARV